MLSATYKSRRLHKDKNFLQPLSKDKSRVFSKDNKLEELSTLSGYSMDSVEIEPGPSAGTVPKYSKQDLQ